MRISVLERGSGKTVRLEVERDHTAGSVVDAIVDGLNLSKSAQYELRREGRVLKLEGTLAENKVGEGDKLFLETSTPAPEAVPAEIRGAGVLKTGAQPETIAEESRVIPPKPTEKKPQHALKAQRSKAQDMSASVASPICLLAGLISAVFLSYFLVTFLRTSGIEFSLIELKDFCGTPFGFLLILNTALLIPAVLLRKKYGLGGILAAAIAVVAIVIMVSMVRKGNIANFGMFVLVLLAALDVIVTVTSAIASVQLLSFRPEELEKIRERGTGSEAATLTTHPAGRVPKVCGQCGAHLRSESKFCLDCGAPARE